MSRHFGCSATLSLTCASFCSFVFTLEEFVRELIILIQAMVDVSILSSRQC